MGQGGGEYEYDPVTGGQKWVPYFGSTPSSYTVKPNDSWESIAKEIYGNGRMFQELMAANGGGFMLHPGMQIQLPNKVDNPFVSNELAASLGMATSAQITGAYNTPGQLHESGKMKWALEQGQMNQLWASKWARGEADPLQYGQLPDSFAKSLGSVSGTSGYTAPRIAKFEGLSTTPITKPTSSVTPVSKLTTPTAPEQVGTYMEWVKKQNQIGNKQVSYNQYLIAAKSAGAPKNVPPTGFVTPQMSSYTKTKPTANGALGFEELERLSHPDVSFGAPFKKLFNWLGKAIASDLSKGVAGEQTKLADFILSDLSKGAGWSSPMVAYKPEIKEEESELEPEPEVETPPFAITESGGEFTIPAIGGASLADLLAQYNVGPELWKLDWTAIRKASNIWPWGYTRDYGYYGGYGGGGSSGNEGANYPGNVNMYQATG